MSVEIAGAELFSTVDWPGHLVATIFCQGCPASCTYCFNRDLIDPRARGTVAWDALLPRLEARASFLDGVVFSGGEALRQDIEPLVLDVRSLGLEVGLHTGGMYPARLERLVGRLDWVGLDVKTPDAGLFAWPSPRSERSLSVLRDTDHEVRCTVTPWQIPAARGIVEDLAIRGETVILQPARGDWRWSDAQWSELQSIGTVRGERPTRVNREETPHES